MTWPTGSLSGDKPVGSRRSVTAAMVSITVGSLPVFLLAALAVLMRRDLGFTESQLGIGVSVFFASSALASVPGGCLAERFGAARTMAWACYGSAVSLLGIGLLARTWWHLAGFLVVGGVALAAAGPATNLAVSHSAPPGRMGLYFGMKQSAVPAASLAAGLAVPVIGLTLGWRAAFILAAAACVAAFLAVSPPKLARGSALHMRQDAPSSLTPPLIVLAAAAALGSAGGNSMTAFYVESAVARGISLGVAGGWLVAGSICAIVGRLFWGWVADRPNHRSLLLVSWLWTIGAAGVAMLSFANSTILLGLATVLAFGAGWAWNGLFHFSIVRSNSAAPAAATGVTTTGMFVGGTIGPSVFGILVHRFSYTPAWLASACTLLLAALLVRVGRRMLDTNSGA